MCLRSISKTGMNESGIGYKAFIRVKATKELYGLYRNLNGSPCNLSRTDPKYPLNTFLDATYNSIYANDSRYYRSGFHIFLNKEHAEMLAKKYNNAIRGFSNSSPIKYDYSDIEVVVLPVKYHKGHTLGYECVYPRENDTATFVDAPVIIADKMAIMSEEVGTQTIEAYTVVDKREREEVCA